MGSSPTLAVQVLVSCLLIHQFECLPQDVREELLSEHDILAVQQKEYGSESPTSFVSPQSNKCLVVPSDAGCTMWMKKTCRKEPHSSLTEMYHPDCVDTEGHHKVRDCQIDIKEVPVQNTATICGYSVERDCDGPCYNCPTFCRAQKEERCWTNHQVQKKLRLCHLFDCKNVQNGEILPQESEKDSDSMFIEEVETLDSFSTCTESQVGEVCAPINCRFGNETRECREENSTQILEMKTMRCRLCSKKMTQVINIADKCQNNLQKDCRIEYKQAWRKYCSDSEQSRKELIELLKIDKKELLEVTDHQVVREKPRNNKLSNDELFANTLDPVNNLIIETLRKIKVEDLNEDSVVIITPRPSDHNEITSTRGNSQTLTTSEERILEENTLVLDSLLEEVEQQSRDAPEQARTIGVDSNSDRKEVNVNVKYTFVDNNGTGDNSEAEPTIRFDEVTSAVTKTYPEITSLVTRTTERPFPEVRSDTSTPKKISTISEKEIATESSENIYPFTRSEIYFNPLFQVLNDREDSLLRNEEEYEGDFVLAEEDILFGNQPTLPDFLTVSSRPTTTTTFTTTATTTFTTIATTTTTFTTTLAVVEPESIGDVGVEETVDDQHGDAGETPDGHHDMSPAELLKLCFHHNIGCDFSLPIEREEPPPSTPRPRLTQELTTPPPPINRRLTNRNKKKLEEASEKFRLCFEFGICTDAELNQRLNRGSSPSHVESPRSSGASQQSRRSSRGGSRSSSRGRSSAGAGGGAKYDDIKAKAVACIWRGVC